jgi:hypothetical protein
MARQSAARRARPVSALPRPAWSPQCCRAGHFFRLGSSSGRYCAVAEGGSDGIQRHAVLLALHSTERRCRRYLGWAPLSPLVLALIIVALAAGQIWLVRTQLIVPPEYRQSPMGIIGLLAWLAVPVISLSILAIGGCFALIGYAFVRTALGTFPH